MDIYQKLGCTLDGEKFIRKWKQGERIKESNDKTKMLISNVIEDQDEPNN